MFGPAKDFSHRIVLLVVGVEVLHDEIAILVLDQIDTGLGRDLLDRLPSLYLRDPLRDGHLYDLRWHLGSGGGSGGTLAVEYPRVLPCRLRGVLIVPPGTPLDEGSTQLRYLHLLLPLLCLPSLGVRELLLLRLALLQCRSLRARL